MSQRYARPRHMVGLTLALAVWFSGLVLPVIAQRPAAQPLLPARSIRQALPMQRASNGTVSVPDSRGTDFWLAFPGNLSEAELVLFLTSDQDTTGTVTIAGLEFTSSFVIRAGTVTTLTLPSAAALDDSDIIADKGIHITAGNDISVYGLSRVPFTTDAYLGLPTDILGHDNIVMGYQNADVVNGTQFAIVATTDTTTVTITPSVTTGAHPAGMPYSLTKHQGQSYFLRNTGPAPNDLSGTIIAADQPIAVFGGHRCDNIPPT